MSAWAQPEPQGPAGLSFRLHCRMPRSPSPRIQRRSSPEYSRERTQRDDRRKGGSSAAEDQQEDKRSDRHKEGRYSREQTEDKRERGDRREERKGRRAGSEERKRSRSPVPAPRVERDDTWKHDRCVCYGLLCICPDIHKRAHSTHTHGCAQHTYTHTHAHTHAHTPHTHTHTHTHSHAHMHTCTHSSAHNHTQHSHTCSPSHLVAGGGLPPPVSSLLAAPCRTWATGPHQQPLGVRAPTPLPPPTLVGETGSLGTRTSPQKTSRTCE